MSVEFCVVEGASDVVVDVVVGAVVVVEVVVVIVGITKIVVVVDEVVVETSGGNVVVVVVVASFPTTKVNIGVFAKLYESPVHVPPVGLSLPYAYIWYVPARAGAFTVTVNVAVRRSAESVGLPYTPLIHGVLRTM
jgi:hypothetical protein